MSELIPVTQAASQRSSLLEYLGTTFSLNDVGTRLALTEFLDNPTSGMFRGPYVRLRLPFARAAEGWREHFEWYEGFRPYGHQAATFARLSSLTNPRPLPTLVTTGTGSGKTESFLMPILDHVSRAKRQGIDGMKAIILYPMNALANDQAGRLTTLLTQHADLDGITAALYTGQGGPERSKVTVDGLITSREIIRDTPPDILLTNYKMLDQLLLREKDAKLWRESATSLTYLVIDEFHTYDGAQGTDVSMLLRRLGIALKSYWSDDDPTITPADRARPLGRITPVATSATLGSSEDATGTAALLEFATTVTGETFGPDAVITESRIAIEDWVGEAPRWARAHRWLPLDLPDAASDLAALAGQRLDAEALTRAALAALFRVAPADVDLTREVGAVAPAASADWALPDLSTLDEQDLLELAKAHPVIADLGDLTGDALDLTELATALTPRRADAEYDPITVVSTILTALSHLRARVGRDAVSVDVHLWVRELTRVDRIAGSSPQFRWSDDGVVITSHGEEDSPGFPAIYCRHCGRSGWGVALAPTGTDLDTSDADIRGRHLRRDERFRPLIHAPGEAETVGDGAPTDAEHRNFIWFHVPERRLVLRRDDAAHQEGDLLPVLTHRGDDAGKRSTDDVCPSCEEPDAIRFLGSAIATLLSVALTGLFGTPNLDAAEKKALVFTDSVQDAAHRAGFVQARSHALTLRGVMHQAMDGGAVDLTQLVENMIRSADDPHQRYLLLPPDLADRSAFRRFWEAKRLRDVPNAVIRRVRKRLMLDVQLEFGLRSAVGRTLEATGSVVADVDVDDAVLLAAAREALETPGATDLLDGLGPDDTQLVRWVRGVLHRMRTRGAVQHEWFDTFRAEDGRRWSIWGGRPRHDGMPAFPRGASAPGYPRLGGSATDSDLEPATSPRGWYSGWTSKTMGVDRTGGAHLTRALLTALAKRTVVGTRQSGSGATTFHLSPDNVTVLRADVAALERGDLALACDTCGEKVHAAVARVAVLDGGPCLVDRCAGHLHRQPLTDNFYRRMYAAPDVRRVVAREHTSLLPDDVRLEYETQFKASDPAPDAPNVLVATPTLEMGVDIGDLSAVMLSSLPKSVASYLQRVGRAGRLTGNSLTLAFVTGRAEQLPRFTSPLQTINGEVRPPATYLAAEEILQRQYIASIADALARRSDAPHPATSPEAIGSVEPGSYLRALVDEAEEDSGVHLDAFLDAFADLPEAAVTLLRGWATRPDGVTPMTSGLAARCLAASAAWRTRVEELDFRRQEIEKAIPELQQLAESPAASSEDKDNLRTARAAYGLGGKQLSELRGEYWVSTLEEFGLLPNYTLLDDSVTLEVSLSWIDPETQEYRDEPIVVERGSAQALRDFAPGATFYARGYAIEIDAVELGPDSVRTWICCPACGYVQEEEPAPSTCPRCRATGIADVAQRLPVVEMKRVSSAMRREEAVIDGERDERLREQYQVATLADIDPERVVRRWFVDSYGFGATYVRDMTVRWANLGKGSARGASRTLANEESTAPLFRLCSACGKLDTTTGANRASEHRPWCRLRRATEEEATSIALTRSLRTEGLVLRLPSSVTLGDRFAIPSLSAAVLLALRERHGGSPDHLAIAPIVDPSPRDEENPDALLLHDIVPGGTGYLAELADPEAVWAMLRRAWYVLRECPCRFEGRLACERCLLPFAHGAAVERTSRAVAERALRALLFSGSAPTGVDELLEVAEDMRWLVTAEEPTAPDRESQLEQLFRMVLRQRLETLGATITEQPGTEGTAWQIVLGGGRRWRLEPQQFVAGSKPDFVLTSNHPEIPPTAIFTDGWRYHASPIMNRIADDAAKRENLRIAGYQVLAFTWEDLDAARTPSTGSVTVPWLAPGATQVVLAQAKDGLSPATLDLVTRPPFELLIDWIGNPAPDRRTALARWLPLLVLPKARGQGLDGEVPLAEAGVRALDGDPVPTGATVGGVWRYDTLAVAVRVTDRTSFACEIATVLDDRTDAVGQDHKDAWREWLRLANLLSFSEGGMRITAASITKAGPAVEPEDHTAADEQDISPAWAPLIHEAMPEERELLYSLADLSFVAPAPVLGEEAGDGIPITLSWPAVKVAVDMGELAEADRESLRTQGWRLVPADVAELRKALED
ncbi:DEAD/DEAH box helicase [Pseudactinotalea suaedae]|uniref:DEAD/DEAH box helicase n=1 Tax=Pseudactinotalea suaedae TaxID=1524924 RepID=UPI0012E2F2D9|nr:DEAD/DEAH box helicase [Pseudactinotalea suaedae]